MAEPSMLEQTIEVVAELREVLVEGRALLTDLRHERKACEQLIRDLDDAGVAAADRHLEERVNELIEAELKKLFEQLGEQQRKAEQRVIRSFDQIANHLMYGNGQGRGENVLVAAARRRNGGDRG